MVDGPKVSCHLRVLAVNYIVVAIVAIQLSPLRNSSSFLKEEISFRIHDAKVCFLNSETSDGHTGFVCSQ